VPSGGGLRDGVEDFPVPAPWIAGFWSEMRKRLSPSVLVLADLDDRFPFHLSNERIWNRRVFYAFFVASADDDSITH
jgi:hypothetical protein